MRKLILQIVCLWFLVAQGQVKITDQAEKILVSQINGALMELDASDSNKGIRLPIVKLTDTSTYQLSGSPNSDVYQNAKGMMVYHLGNPASPIFELKSKGLFIWDGSQWRGVTDMLHLGISNQAVPFGDVNGNLTQDATKFLYNSSTQQLTVPHLQLFDDDDPLQWTGTGITNSFQLNKFGTYTGISFDYVLDGNIPGTSTAAFTMFNIKNSTTPYTPTAFQMKYDDDATGISIKKGGNVGIGTTNPQNKLDVEGGIAIGTSYAGTNTAPTNGVIIEGQVGIATNSVPTGHTFNIGGNTSGTNQIIASIGTSNTDPRLYLQAGNNEVAVNSRNNFPIAMKVNNTTTATIDGDKITAKKFVQSNSGIYVTAVGVNDNFIPNYTVTATFAFNTVVSGNSGGWFNTTNYTFTAPVKGIYTASANVRFQDISNGTSNYIRCYISVNNTSFEGDPRNLETLLGATSSGEFAKYAPMTPSGTVFLNAGETLRVKGGAGAGNTTVHMSQSQFTIALIQEIE